MDLQIVNTTYREILETIFQNVHETKEICGRYISQATQQLSLIRPLITFVKRSYMALHIPIPAAVDALEAKINIIQQTINAARRLTTFLERLEDEFIEQHILPEDVPGNNVDDNPPAEADDNVGDDAADDAADNAADNAANDNQGNDDGLADLFDVPFEDL